MTEKHAEYEMLNRFPRMMQEYLTRRLRHVYGANHRRVMGMTSREEALEYVREVRRKWSVVFSGMPPRCPLNTRVTGEIDRTAYVIRKLIFESRPGFLVTANMYIPKTGKGPRPGVLCLCGHMWNAKAYELYQSFPQTLAGMGYVTLIFDPIGQFERLQYTDDSGKSLLGAGVMEHNMAGKQMLPADEMISTWFIHDGIRALDVLLEQANIDPARIGVTGNSGGGNMTAFAVACDPRITMSAPSCYVTSWHHNGINEEPQDAEQLPPGALGLGLEQSDLLIAGAPKPVILLTQEQDFFDQRGSVEAWQRIRHIYELLGAEDSVGYYTGPGEHGYHKDAREAMYAFFNKHAGIEAPPEEPEPVIEDIAALQCTASGQVSGTGSKSVCDFIVQKADSLSVERGRPPGSDLAERVKALLKLPPRPAPPDYRILRNWTPRGYARPHAGHFVIESDMQYGAQAIVTKLEDAPRVSRPLPGKGHALLYIPHLSSDRELREEPVVRSMEEDNEAFFACDCRGIGESMPDTCRADSFFHSYGSDYHYASYSLLLGESYTAWRVHDILCVLDWMEEFRFDRIHLVGNGFGAVPATLAALIDSRIERITLIHAPVSYEEVVRTRLCRWPLSSMLPGVLKHFDLPDIYAELEAKQMEMIDPWDGMMQPVTDPDSGH